MRFARTVFFVLLAMKLAESLGISAEEARLEIVVPGTSHAAGESIILQVTYLNPTAATLTNYYKRSPDISENFQIEVTGPGDKPAEKTAFFRSLIEAKKTRLSDDASFIIDAVEQKKPMKRELLLSLYFDCTAVGDYSGRVTTSNIKDGEEKPVPLTGTFTFTVGWPR